jgi:hypothetical protein
MRVDLSRPDAADPGDDGETMTVRTLPEHADTSQLRARAKDLRRAYAGGNPAAVVRVRAVHPDAGAEIPLRDAQLVIAREHDLPSWRDLVAAVVAQQSGGRDLHRWFGVELNNGTWDLLNNGLSQDSPQLEREQALYGVYASTYHWMQVGTVANHGRGEYMIASVATAIGLLDVAQRHADRYAELIAAHPAAFTDWDRAFSAEALARVASRSAAPDAEALRARAHQLVDAVADPDDRRVCQERLSAAPW